MIHAHFSINAFSRISLCFLLAFTATWVQAAVSVIGDLPTSGNTMRLEIKVTGITTINHDATDPDLTRQQVELYLGGTASANKVIWEDEATDATEIIVSAVNTEADDNREGSYYTYTYVVEVKGNDINLLEFIDAKSTDGSLKAAAKVTIASGVSDDNLNSPSLLIKSNYAINEAPSNPRAESSYRSLTLSWDKKDSVTAIGDKDTATPTSVTVFLFDPEAGAFFINQALRRANNGDTSAAECQVVAQVGACACPDAHDVYIDVSAVKATGSLKIETAASDATSVVFNELENDKEYLAFMQYEGGLKRTQCVSATPIEDYTSTEGAGEGKAKPVDFRCFIATAAYDNDLMHPDMQIFRRFRDEVLLQLPFGKQLVEAYYHVGPQAAEFVRRHPYLKKLTRNTLASLAHVLRRSSDYLMGNAYLPDL